ncbi:MAG: hypothetical protein HC769_14745 [Cyanobacteria bacterium CRU_2_1]|nr:hypothetical protein [Cyanobacteria bacterium RU_5_0]NJR59980.1 hypothetical protein [Cyanobacteria bacterium CRU_2_1]
MKLLYLLIGLLGFGSATIASATPLSTQANWARAIEIMEGIQVAQLTSVDPDDLNRAKNLARQAAETENGGLSQYRAEPAMHGSAAESPYVDNGDGSVTFTFFGSIPGEEVYSYESIVTIDTVTWDIVVNYNGTIR